MKIAILHDYFDKMGGGERLVIELAKTLNADIYTGFVDYSKTYEGIKQLKVHELIKPVKNPVIRTIKLIKAFSSLNISDKYDYFILSGTYAIYASKNHHPNLWYCHTPARWLYSQREWFYKNSNMIKKIILLLLEKYVKPKDQEAVKNIDKIAANSRNVANRIRKFYGSEYFKKTKVVYPFVDIKKFVWIGQKDYYLSYGRVDKLKRVEMIVRAFLKMPNKKLIVASSGPELNKIKGIAKDHKNIEILGYVSDKELRNLVGNCIATIYIPVDEDFGMTPVESMSAGKPCIGVNDGGLKETIIHKKTGYLCPKNLTYDDVKEAVEWMTKARALKMKNECIRNAKKFSKERFIKEMESIIKNNIIGGDNIQLN